MESTLPYKDKLVTHTRTRGEFGLHHPTQNQVVVIAPFDLGLLLGT
jgi:hypothetical protein